MCPRPYTRDSAMRSVFALRIVLVLLAASIVSTTAEAKGTVHVRAYTRKDGTYVSAHTRSAPRTTGRTAAPTLRTTESRTYAPRTLDPAFEDVPPPNEKAKRSLPPVDSDIDPKDEVKAQKLLDFARRQYAMGEIEVGVRWLRWVRKKYKPTTAATEAGSLMEEWKKDEPYKTWTDSTGKFSVEARFVRFDAGTVNLQTKSGKIITLDIKRLCRSDQDYIMNREGL